MEILPTSYIVNNVYDKDKKKLKVDAVIETGDIEIGAVELKDANTESRAYIVNGQLYTSPRNISQNRIIFYISASEKYEIYNPSYTYSYDSNGNLTEIQLTATDTAGNTKTFKKTYTYTNGNLTSVSSWQVV